MKKSNLLLILPLVFVSTVGLASCSEDQKFETKLVENIRIEDKTLKWDYPSGIEMPYTEVTINGTTYTCYGNELNLSKIINKTAKTKIDFVCKPYLFSFLFKDTKVSKTFLFYALDKPLIYYNFEDKSLRIECLEKMNLDIYINSEHIVSEENIYGIKNFEPKKDTLIKACTVQTELNHQLYNYYDSDYSQLYFNFLDAPVVKIVDNKLVWDKVEEAFSYKIFRNGKIEEEVETPEYKLPSFAVASGDTYEVQAIGKQDLYLFDSEKSNTIVIR